MTKSDIVRDLRALGLRTGDAVLLHSSLSSIGRVEGGAGTVVDAFLEVLGDTGTLAVPAFGKLGVIAEAVKTHPRVVRSVHPMAAVAAIGASAEAFCRDHWKAELAHGLDTPYTRIADAGGYVCLLGADQDGNTAPRTWKGGFQYWMWHDLFGRINPRLRMPEKQIHFPATRTVNAYSRMLEDLGGADKAYGGIGWGGHIAFYEPHVAIRDHGADMQSFLNQGSCIVDLHPITICQNCLYADAGSAGDWSWVPPKAATIGPRDLAQAKLVSFWDGFGAGESVWQRFISRLAAHGPVTPAVPASMLQVVKSELILSGIVAADCSVETSERRVPIEF